MWKVFPDANSAWPSPFKVSTLKNTFSTFVSYVSFLFDSQVLLLISGNPVLLKLDFKILVM